MKQTCESMDKNRIEAPVPDECRERELRQQVTQLKRVVADKTLEADFFKGALHKIEARRRSRSNSGETASTSRFEK
jgi:hypothetical protein